MILASKAVAAISEIASMGFFRTDVPDLYEAQLPHLFHKLCWLEKRKHPFAPSGR